MLVLLRGPNAGTGRINCLKYKWLHCITSMHCFYYIQYCKVFKGFFSFLFSLCFFHAKDIFSSQLLLIIITSSPRGGRGLCFKWLLEITKLFHTHTGRSNPSGPPITFSFIYIPTIPTQAMSYAKKSRKRTGTVFADAGSFLTYGSMAKDRLYFSLSEV